jgi:uncharacterized membrane protein YdjX (TVP38/TMEM64 family)
MAIWFEKWREWMTALLMWIEGMGAMGWVLFWFFFVLCCVLWLPGSLWTIAAGAIYGLPGGVCLVLISSMSGAVATLWMGRYVLRPWVQSLCGSNATFQALLRGIEKEGVKIIFLARLSPVLPSSVMNYGLGLTGLRTLPFALASGLGALPSIIVYVYFGSLMGDWLHLDLAQLKESATMLWLNGLGLVAAILVTWKLTQIARAALKEKISEV